MKLLSSGSSIISVNVCLNSFNSLSLSKNINILVLNYELLESPINTGLLSYKCVYIFSNNPSTVVYTPPNVPYYNSNSISGIVKYAESLLYKSLYKSSSYNTFNVIFLPYILIAPPVLTSVECAPQWSHVNAITIISLKYGILLVHILTKPSL